jgi:L-arabinonolactonase
LTRYRVERALSIGSELGEHPIWEPNEQRLYWLDIEKATINRFEPETAAYTAWALPARPGCFAFSEAGHAVIAAQDGLYSMDFESGAVERRLATAHDPAVMRCNDGRTDRQGRLWVGTVRVDMDLTATADNAYYRLDGGGLTKVLDNVGITNGAAFGPDGTVMYRAQTEARQIFAYDYDPALAAPTNPRLFATVPEDLGMPDGATVDTDGGYWVALAAPPGGPPTGGVARFAPDGRLDRYVDLPVPFVTMPAFGGPDLSRLYVTTARLEAFMPDGAPIGAGDLYVIETEFKGVPETRFRGW